MNKSLAIALLACAAGAANAQTNVGVSIGISQPGVYGRIDIGNTPPPPVVYAEPVIIRPSPYASARRPIYLYAPEQHQRNWGRYCGQYNACGQPVYFVREQWVRERYQHDHPGWHDRRDHGRPGDRGDRGHRGN